jgi:hypothetical protein
MPSFSHAHACNYQISEVERVRREGMREGRVI